MRPLFPQNGAAGGGFRISRPGHEETTSTEKTANSPRSVLADLGATGALIWAPRAAFSIDGGFEGRARDLSVLFVDLPRILLGGVLLPYTAWTLTRTEPAGPGSRHSRP